MSFKSKRQALIEDQTLELWLPNLQSDLEEAKGTLLTDEAIAEREKYQSSLWEFFLKSWEVLEPGTTLHTNWHQELIIEYLELVDSGDIKKLLINIAPRSLKSKICSVIFPVWQWLRRPSLSHLCCSYVSTLANDLSDDRRTLIQSDWFRGLCPEIELSNTKNRISEFKNNFRGEMNSRGLEAGITGIGAIIHVYDDPNDPDKIESDNIRDRTLRRYKDYSVGRRNDPVNYAIVVIQQRTHQEDISGYILDNDPEFTALILPTVAEEEETITFPKSGKIIERKRGDLLHPERFGKKQVEEARTTLGSYMFAGRHQQRPVPREGGILKEQYWQYYLALPPCKIKVWAWDTAFKTGSQNDYSAGVLMGISNHNYYILDVYCDRLEYPDLKRRIIQLHERDRTNAVVVEDKASGQSLIQELSRTTSLPIVAQKADRDKIARVNAIAPTVEAGKVFLPHTGSWVVDFVMECSQFPNGAHDDRVDAFGYALNYLISSNSGYRIATTGKKRASAKMRY